MGIRPGEPDNNMYPRSEIFKTWSLSEADEVKKYFGSSFLIPSYVPESFKLDNIEVSWPDESKADKAIFGYSAGNNSFLIIVEKTEMQYKFDGFTKIDINGAAGYLKPGLSVNDAENTGSPDTEIHWFKTGSIIQ